MSTTRVDVRLFELGLAKSRENARSLVMAGVVYVDGVKALKAGTMVKECQSVTLKENPVPFVSRGGLKLEKAMGTFSVELKDKVALDIGASTGGFTDCMLKHGAKRVYAIDVGYGQLDWGLRNDPRVVTMERTNARYMEPEWFDGAPSFASIDVSFISLAIILKPLYICLAQGADVIALVKPQFEAGRQCVGKNGVVRDGKVHVDVIENVVASSRKLGYNVLGLDFSPITGPKGNIEFLMQLQKPIAGSVIDTPEINAQMIVDAAHETLDKPRG